MVRRAGAPAAAALLGAALFCQACAFLGLDMFPPALDRLEASYDLATGLEAEGLSFNRVARIERVVMADGTALVFARLETGSGGALAIVDDALSGIVSIVEDYCLGDFTLADSAGYAACGSAILDSSLALSTYAVDASLRNECVSGYLDGDTAYSLYGSGYYLYRSAFASGAWAETPTVESLPLFEAEYAGCKVLDVLSPGPTSPLVLAILRESDYHSLLLTYADRSAFDEAMGGASGYAGYGATVAELSYSPMDFALWLTPAGAVVLREESGRLRLYRVSLSTGAELDGVDVGDYHYDDCFCVEPEGERWYRYDSHRGLLQKMRTWWE